MYVPKLDKSDSGRGGSSELQDDVGERGVSEDAPIRGRGAVRTELVDAWCDVGAPLVLLTTVEDEMEDVQVAILFITTGGETAVRVIFDCWSKELQ